MRHGKGEAVFTSGLTYKGDWARVYAAPSRCAMPLSSPPEICRGGRGTCALSVAAMRNRPLPACRLPGRRQGRRPGHGDLPERRQGMLRSAPQLAACSAHAQCLAQRPSPPAAVPLNLRHRKPREVARLIGVQPTPVPVHRRLEERPQVGLGPVRDEERRRVRRPVVRRPDRRDGAQPPSPTRSPRLARPAGGGGRLASSAGYYRRRASTERRPERRMAISPPRGSRASTSTPTARASRGSTGTASASRCGAGARPPLPSVVRTCFPSAWSAPPCRRFRCGCA